MLQSEPDHAFDRELAKFIAWLKATKHEASTRRGQTLIIRPRRPKKSRINGRAVALWQSNHFEYCQAILFYNPQFSS